MSLLYILKVTMVEILLIVVTMTIINIATVKKSLH